MNNTTLELFKSRINGYVNEITEAQNAYFIAKAAEETLKEMENDIQRKILEAGNYMICDEFKEKAMSRGRTSDRITEPSTTYLMDEDIFINDFLEKVYSEYKAAGIASPKGKEYIPSAELTEKKIEAENVLLKLAVDILPETMQEERNALESASKHWKYRNELLKIILKLKAE